MEHDIIFEKAESEYVKGDLARAFELFLKAANAGNDSAMDRVASMYEDAEGVDYDYEKAIEWYIKAVEAGSITSLYNLGVSYRTKGDILIAIEWFEKAFRAGDVDAAMDLAKIFMVCEKEKDKAARYLNHFLENSDPSDDSRKEAQDILTSLNS